MQFQVGTVSAEVQASEPTVAQNDVNRRPFKLPSWLLCIALSVAAFYVEEAIAEYIMMSSCHMDAAASFTAIWVIMAGSACAGAAVLVKRRRDAFVPKCKAAAFDPPSDSSEPKAASVDSDATESHAVLRLCLERSSSDVSTDVSEDEANLTGSETPNSPGSATWCETPINVCKFSSEE